MDKEGNKMKTILIIALVITLIACNKDNVLAPENPQTEGSRVKRYNFYDTEMNLSYYHTYEYTGDNIRINVYSKTGEYLEYYKKEYENGNLVREYYYNKSGQLNHYKEYIY